MLYFRVRETIGTVTRDRVNITYIHRAFELNYRIKCMHP